MNKKNHVLRACVQCTQNTFKMSPPMVGPQHMCKVRTIDRISKLIFDEQGRNWHEEKANLDGQSGPNGYTNCYVKCLS